MFFFFVLFLSFDFKTFSWLEKQNQHSAFVNMQILKEKKKFHSWKKSELLTGKFWEQKKEFLIL